MTVKPNPRLTALAAEATDLRGGIDYLDALAGEQGRDLTELERTAYNEAGARIDAISSEITEVNERTARFDAIAPVTATLAPEVGRTRVEHVEPRTPVVATGNFGELYRSDIVKTEELGSFALTLGRMKLGKISEEAAQEELGRTVAHGVAADGTAPVTIEGDLIKFVDATRYAVNASRRLPMPDNHAPTFKRPRVTQRTTVAVQATEGDILSSQRMQLTGDTVTKGTYGGVLALSEQEIDWTDPALLGLAIQDLAESYGIATDTVLTAAIVAAAVSGNKTILSLTAASADFIAALASAAGTVYGNAKRMADTLFVSVDRWAYLAGLVDGDGRPLFPIAGPLNNAGMNANGVASFAGFSILGLDVVVDPNFVSNTWIVGVASLCETYEQNKGLLNIAVPSTLEVQYAYRGYFAANCYQNAFSPFAAS